MTRQSTERSNQTVVPGAVRHQVGIGVVAQDGRGRENFGLKERERLSVWNETYLERAEEYGAAFSLLCGRPTCFAPPSLSLSPSLPLRPSFFRSLFPLSRRSFYRSRASRRLPLPSLHFTLNFSQCVSIRPGGWEKKESLSSDYQRLRADSPFYVTLLREESPRLRVYFLVYDGRRSCEAHRLKGERWRQ